MDKSISDKMREWGRRGGEANLAKYGKEKFKRIGRLGGLKRWHWGQHTDCDKCKEIEREEAKNIRQD